MMVIPCKLIQWCRSRLLIAEEKTTAGEWWTVNSGR